MNFTRFRGEFFLNPLESVIYLPSAMGKIAQKCLKWVKFTVKLPILDIFNFTHCSW
jgi:hypothetical protein